MDVIQHRPNTNYGIFSYAKGVLNYEVHVSCQSMVDAMFIDLRSRIAMCKPSSVNIECTIYNEDPSTIIDRMYLLFVRGATTGVLLRISYFSHNDPTNCVAESIYDREYLFGIKHVHIVPSHPISRYLAILHSRFRGCGFDQIYHFT